MLEFADRLYSHVGKGLGTMIPVNDGRVKWEIVYLVTLTEGMSCLFNTGEMFVFSPEEMNAKVDLSIVVS